MTQETTHLLWIIFWLVLINVAGIILWAIMALSGQISREEEAQQDPAEREWYK